MFVPYLPTDHRTIVQHEILLPNRAFLRNIQMFSQLVLVDIVVEAFLYLQSVHVRIQIEIGHDLMLQIEQQLFRWR